MSYNSPSDSLDEIIVCKYLIMTNKLSLYELIQLMWKDGLIKF